MSVKVGIWPNLGDGEHLVIMEHIGNACENVRVLKRTNHKGGRRRNGTGNAQRIHGDCNGTYGLHGETTRE